MSACGRIWGRGRARVYLSDSSDDSSVHSIGGHYQNLKMGKGDADSQSQNLHSGEGRLNAVDLANDMSTLSISDSRTNSRSSLGGTKPEAPTSCFTAPRLPPAKVQEKVNVKTNVYPLKLEDRIVYRYDVFIEAQSVRSGTRNATKIDLCRGRQDPYRTKKCMLLIDLALREYREFKEFAYAYDLSSTLFTNQPLDTKKVSRISISSKASEELKSILGSQVVVTISITECREFAHTFRTTDFSSSITSDLLAQDHSLRQFYEILTNQSGLRSGSYFSFGCGRLYLTKGKETDLKRGMKLLSGVEKGVRFVEGSSSTGLVPALVLDAKKTPFFDEEAVIDFAAEVYMPKSTKLSIPKLDKRTFQGFWQCVGPLLRGLRLIQLNSTKTFIATGLSSRPTMDLRKGRISLVEAYKNLKINIRPDLPAVMLKSSYGTAYFPMEILYISPHQKVMNTKLQPKQTQFIIKNAAVLPNMRLKEIRRHLTALNLDDCNYNPILAAFGVRISANPLEIEANRRIPPQICYGPTNITQVQADKANWSAGNNQFVSPAKIGIFHLLYDSDCDDKIMQTFFDSLCKAAEKRGIRFEERSTRKVPMEKLEANFKTEIKKTDQKTIFIMYVDNERNAHHKLKLFETIYQVITQHVKFITVKEKAYTVENIINKMNAKNFGHNHGTLPETYATKRWLSNGDTLVIGYDVCHPEPQSSIERRLNLSPTQPSVVGISFNAAENPETFIGDYAFHEPKKEQVTSHILENRMFHILKLFEEMRQKLPKLILITRDGVSEGQHKMVMMEELEAIRAGIQNYIDCFGKTGYSPKLVLLTAVKRHNKRFFIEKDGEVENCLPGTVIDHTVTRTDVTEIFMQSHKVIKGTGKIPAYTLLVNEANMEMDELQAFINALCYSHQIITSAISIPEPVFQADEWAKRGRNNFRTMYHHESMLPRKRDGTVDWDEVTNKLCYKDRTLQLTRSNA